MPHVSGVVAAFGAFDAYSWQGAEFLFFFADYSDELLGVVLYDFGYFWLHFVGGFWFLVAAFGASKNQSCFFSVLGFFWFKTGTAFWAKFHRLLHIPFGGFP